MFDEQPHAIAAQISAWETPWLETSWVADRGDGIVGYIGVELDDAQPRVWIHGPVVDDRDWDVVADALLTALDAELPVTRASEAEVAADVENARIAEFATRHGFIAGKVHHLLALPAPRIEPLPRGDAEPLSSEHEDAFVELHEQLFPGTYYSGRQLLAQAAQGEAMLLQALDDDELAGYAAGRIDEAGDGYLDFVGVAPGKLRRGFGGALAGAMGHALRDRAPISAMRLTVSGDNTAALALYGLLGFERQANVVAYRRPPESYV